MMEMVKDLDLETEMVKDLDWVMEMGKGRGWVREKVLESHSNMQRPCFLDL